MVVNVGGKLVGKGQPIFVIAELGINHNGQVEIAKELIDVAVSLGADAVKFQKRTVDVVYGKEELEKPREVPLKLLRQAMDRHALPLDNLDRLTRSGFKDMRTGDQKYTLEFGRVEYNNIAEYCAEKGIMWSASPWDEASVDFLDDFGVPFYKIASPSLTDDGLLRHVRSKGRPVILSTGMSSMEQIHHAVDVLGQEDLIILHCTSEYPKEDSRKHLGQLNLLVIQTLEREFPGVPIGYSSNDGGRIPALLAAGLGAVVLEVHLTLDHGMYGSDQGSSMEPVWFRDLSEWLDNVPVMLGDGVKIVYPGEVALIKKLRRKG